MPPETCPVTVGWAGWLVRAIAIVAIALYTAGVFALIARQLRASYRVSGRLLWAEAAKAAGYTLLVSVPMGLGVLVEGRGLATYLDPSHQAWALLFGDPLLVPLMVGLAVVVWQRRGRPGSWLRHPVTLVVAMVLGLGWAVYFRIDEAGVYTPGRYWALSKLAHDESSVPVIATLMAIVLATIVAGLFSPAGDLRSKVASLGLAALFVVFYLLLQHDGTGLDPTFLHSWVVWGPWPHAVAGCA